MIKKCFLFSIMTLILNQNSFAKAVDKTEIDNLVKFLVSDKILTASKDKLPVPLSYYIGNKENIAAYFGDYVCKTATPESTCSVVDELYKAPYAILGAGLPPENGTAQELSEAQAQIERTDMLYGADIYDTATWQIALALAYKNGSLEKSRAESLINNQNKRIQNAENRATDKLFQYGYNIAIPNPLMAFTFRMLATDFHNKDPFYQSRYQAYVTPLAPQELAALAKGDKQHRNADYFKYVTTWSDWKPITGENAWAQLIGPLQAEDLLKEGKVPANSAILTNAINSLYAFSAMQSASGGLYYAPGGSEGNQGPIPEGEISLENNFSVLGGLQILDHVLKKTEQTAQVKAAQESVKILLYGGKTVNNFTSKGLLSFIYNHGFDKSKGIFYTHGAAINPSIDEWQPDNSGKPASMAVDVNTWGIAALGVETVDHWYGEGSALKIWNQVKEKGGYFNNGQLWGVGYTLNNAEDKIMSTEWTAGAINAVNVMIQYYEKKGVDVAGLKDDLMKMEAGIAHLRNDRYLGSGFDNETPKENFMALEPEAGYAYLYASKRFAIPFGWNANSLPSTTSNAWVIMNKISPQGYNPFQYQGKLSGENYPIPESSPDNNDDLPAVTVKFDAGVESAPGNLGPISQLSLSYKTNLETPLWTTAKTIDTTSASRAGFANLPKGTKAISIAFNNKGWAGACQVIPASKICVDKDCHSIRTIQVIWSSDGLSPCKLAASS